MYNAKYKDFNKIVDVTGHLTGHTKLKFCSYLLNKNRDGKLINFHQQYKYKDTEGNMIKSINRTIKWKYYIEQSGKDIPYKSFTLNHFDLYKLEALKKHLIETSFKIGDDVTILLSYDRMCKFTLTDQNIIRVEFDNLICEDMSFLGFMNSLCVMNSIEPTSYCSLQLLYATSSCLVNDDFTTLNGNLSIRKDNESEANNINNNTSNTNMKIKKKNTSIL